MLAEPELLLGVNIDHAATLRQARYREHARDCGQIVEPDLLMVALLSERAGADGITVHLREDRRHIQDRDVHRIREAIQTRLNLEMACTDEMIAFAKEVKPEIVCLVPEGRMEVTTEGGLDVVNNREVVKKVVDEMHAAGIETSLFIDPSPEQVDASAELGSEYVELHTGAYAHAYYQRDAREEEYAKLVKAAEQAFEAGLVVNAGHGINYVNIKEVRTIPYLHELNIGHSILSRALMTGLEEAVSEMKNLMLG